MTQNRTALVALTAMRNYDNYTFTHMVNVSILTMGQARALGIEGRLLREFGLSALMHDIGKVRTPKEILNKPERLTEDEFVIMRRHPVEGAEILRRTPGDADPRAGRRLRAPPPPRRSGLPAGARRDALNLGTMLCSIADVYDAMRSQRAYQQALPTDRVLAVLKKDDGIALRRRTWCGASCSCSASIRRAPSSSSTSDAIAVVVKVHAPDPYRPRVKLLFAADGAPYERPLERNLWERERRRRTRRTASSRPSIRRPTASIPLNYLDDRTRMSEGLRTVAVAVAGLGRRVLPGRRCGPRAIPASRRTAWSPSCGWRSSARCCWR